MKPIKFIFVLIISMVSCKSQEMVDCIDVQKEISKASLRKVAFYECLNSSVNDSLKVKLNDSSGDNLFYRTAYYSPLNNLNYTDSLFNFSKNWGKKKYPNGDHPGTKMHITNCLNMYESQELDDILEYIYDNAAQKDGNFDMDNHNENQFDEARRYKYAYD